MDGIQARLLGDLASYTALPVFRLANHQSSLLILKAYKNPRFRFILIILAFHAAFANGEKHLMLKVVPLVVVHHQREDSNGRASSRAAATAIFAA